MKTRILFILILLVGFSNRLFSVSTFGDIGFDESLFDYKYDKVIRHQKAFWYEKSKASTKNLFRTMDIISLSQLIDSTTLLTTNYLTNSDQQKIQGKVISSYLQFFVSRSKGHRFEKKFYLGLFGEKFHSRFSYRYLEPTRDNYALIDMALVLGDLVAMWDHIPMRLRQDTILQEALNKADISFFDALLKQRVVLFLIQRKKALYKDVFPDLGITDAATCDAYTLGYYNGYSDEAAIVVFKKDINSELLHTLFWESIRAANNVIGDKRLYWTDEDEEKFRTQVFEPAYKVMTRYYPNLAFLMKIINQHLFSRLFFNSLALPRSKLLVPKLPYFKDYTYDGYLNQLSEPFDLIKFAGGIK